MEPRVRVLFSVMAAPRNPTGMGVYASELTGALAARADVALRIATTRLSPADGSFSRFPLRRSLIPFWEQLRLGPFRREGVDLVHGALHSVPVVSKVPTVATIHDLGFWRLPSDHSWRSRTYHGLLARTARSARAIIVPSAVVADDVGRYLSYPASRIHVIPEAARSSLAPAAGAEMAALRARLREERPYLLCVSTLAPNKRTIDAIRAAALLRQSGKNVALLVAGNPHRMTGALQREVDRLGLGDAVRFLGYVPHEDLRALYSGAVALVFPSTFEGFGLPPLEAMACGTPVITTSVPAMSEVLAGAALFVPVAEPAAIAAAAARLLASCDERRQWSERSLEHAARFSWLRTAAETAAVYHEVAGN